jgi:membrane protease YdiL (CAAX protease family)
MPEASAAQGSFGGKPEPWKFWASTAWGMAAFAAWFAAQIVAALALFTWWTFDQQIEPESFLKLLEHGLAFSLIVLAAAPAELLVIALAARLAHARIADYLALVRPQRRDLFMGFVVVAIVLPLGDLTTWLSGYDVVHPFMVQNYITARDAGMGALFALTLAFAVAAPLTEEITFRGFLYRGWAASPLGPAGAIALISAIWAVIHIQYEAFFMLQIFVLGLIFGWLRWRSGSTLLTMLLHAMINLISVLQTAFVVEWLR